MECLSDGRIVDGRYVLYSIYTTPACTFNALIKRVNVY